MSSTNGYPGSLASEERPLLAARDSLYCVNLNSVSGDVFQMQVSGALRVWDLMAVFWQHHPLDVPGMYSVVVHGSTIEPTLSLQEVGLVDGDDVAMVFEAATDDELVSLHYNYCRGEVDKMTERELLIFSSITYLSLYTSHKEPLSNPGRGIIRSIEKVPLPSGLQSLTCAAVSIRAWTGSPYHLACRA